MKKQITRIKSEHNGFELMQTRLIDCYKFTYNNPHTMTEIRQHCHGAETLYQVLIAHGVLKKSGRKFVWDTIAPNPFMARTVLRDFLKAQKTKQTLYRIGKPAGKNMINVIRGDIKIPIRKDQPKESGPVTQPSYGREKKKGIFEKLWIWLFGE